MSNTGFRHTRLCNAVTAALALPVLSLFLSPALADPANPADDSADSGSPSPENACASGIPAPAIIADTFGLKAVFYQDPDVLTPACHEPGAYLVWDFGDGSKYRVSADNLAVRTIDHVYEENGSYHAEAHFESADGRIGNPPAGIDISVQDSDPVVRIDPDYHALAYRQPEPGDIIRIDGSSSFSKHGHRIVSYLWSTGETTPAINFSLPVQSTSGGRRVSLTVTDETGASRTRSVTISPDGPAFCGVPAAESLWMHFTSGTSENNNTVTFADATSGDLGGLCPENIDSGVPFPNGSALFENDSGDTFRYWDFGDGSPAETAASPIHTYDNSGQYTVLYAADFGEGASVIHTTAQKVTAGATLKAVITAESNDYVDYAPGVITVHSGNPLVLSAADSEGLDDSVTFRWSTGENTPTITITPEYAVHRYSVEITDARGNTSTAEVSVSIVSVSDCGEPASASGLETESDFTWEIRNGDPREIYFRDNSRELDMRGCAWMDSPVEIGVWKWDFGDGSTGEGSEIIHRYDNPGEYQVTLTVTPLNGSTNTIVRKITVSDTEKPVETRYVTLNHNENELLTLNAGKYTENRGYTYRWNGGAGGMLYSGIAVLPREDTVYSVEVFDHEGRKTDKIVFLVKIVRDAECSSGNPEIVITTSADDIGNVVPAGTAVTLDASHTYVASCQENTVPDLSFRWSNGKTDPVITEIVDEDTYLQLEVTDNKTKAVSRFYVSILVKAGNNYRNPVARISSSAKGDTIQAGINTVFTGLVSSADTERTYTYSWTVDAQPAGTDRILNYAFSSLGRHYIHFTATDDLGLSDTAELPVFVEEDRPFVTIEGSSVSEAGEAVVFRAHTRDSDTASCIWTVDGNRVAAPQSAPGSDTLTYVFNTAGSHTVEATVSDYSEGVNNTARHLLTVNPRESNPVKITFADGNESRTSGTAAADDVPFVTTASGMETKDLEMEVQGRMAVKFDNIAGPASLHIIRTEKQGDTEYSVACRTDADRTVSCATGNSGSEGSATVSTADGASLIFPEAGTYRIHISARSPGNAEIRGYIPLSVKEKLNDTPDEDLGEQNDDSGGTASENTGGDGRKGGELDFLSLLFLTGAGFLLRKRRK